MGRLIKFEFEKILKRKIVWAAVLAVLALNGFIYVFTSYPSLDVMGADGAYHKGSQAVEEDRTVSAAYQGVITDETAEQLMADHAEKIEKTSWLARFDYAYDVMARVLLEMTEEGGSLLPVTEAFSENPAFRYFDYGRGADEFLGYMPMIMLVMGYVVIICLAPLFSDEYARGTDALILTSKLGKRQCALSKCTAALIFSAVLAASVIFVNWLLAVVFYGSDGWNMSVQLTASAYYGDVPYEMTIGQAVNWAMAIWFLGMSGLTAVVAMCSSLCRSSFISLIAGLLIYTVPLALTNIIWMPLQRALSFMPAVMSTVSHLLSWPKLGAVNFAVLPLLFMAILVLCAFPVCKSAFGKKVD